MCLAVPAEVIELLPGDMARVSVGGVGGVGGVEQLVSLALLEAVQAGDHVLVHVGFALSRIDVAAAQAAMDLLNELGMTRRAEA